MMARFPFRLMGLLALAPWALCAKTAEHPGKPAEGIFAEVGAHHVHIGAEKSSSLIRTEVAAKPAQKAVSFDDPVTEGKGRGGKGTGESADDDPKHDEATGAVMTGAVSGVMELISTNHSDEFLFNGAAQEAVCGAIAKVAGVELEEVSCGFHQDMKDVETIAEPAMPKADDFEDSSVDELDKFTVGFTVNAPQLEVPDVKDKIAHMAAEAFLHDIADLMVHHDLKPHPITIDGLWVVEGTSLPDTNVVNSSLTNFEGD